MTIASTLAATTAAAALAGSLAGGASLKVTVSAPGHTPKIGPHWVYMVRATEGGKPATGELTEQIVDPLGGRHAVEFGTSTKTITNWRFKGVFRDFIVWPPDSRGIPLTFRVIVVVGGAKRVVDYRVTPR